MKTYPTCPAGLNWREWRAFIDLVEHHKALEASKRIAWMRKYGAVK